MPEMKEMTQAVALKQISRGEKNMAGNLNKDAGKEVNKKTKLKAKISQNKSPAPKSVLGENKNLLTETRGNRELPY